MKRHSGDATKMVKNARFAHAARTDDAITVAVYDIPLGYAPRYAVSKRRVSGEF